MITNNAPITDWFHTWKQDDRQTDGRTDGRQIDDIIMPTADHMIA